MVMLFKAKENNKVLKDFKGKGDKRENKKD